MLKLSISSEFLSHLCAVVGVISFLLLTAKSTILLKKALKINSRIDFFILKQHYIIRIKLMIYIKYETENILKLLTENLL